MQMKMGTSENNDTAAPDETAKTDCLACGVCSLKFPEILDFISHKINHIGQDGKICCCLCEKTFLKTSEIFQHYKVFHRIKISPIDQFNEEQLEDPDEDLQKLSEPQRNRTAITVPEQNGLVINGEKNTLINLEPIIKEPIDESTFSSNKSSNSENEQLDSNNSPLESKNNRFRQLTINKIAEKTKSETMHIQIIQSNSQKDAKISNADDFYFILMLESVQGKHLEYKRISFKCLHCEFKTYARLSIANHMKDRHLDLLGINQSIVVNKHVDNEKQKLMSMSSYMAQCQRSVDLSHSKGVTPKKRKRTLESRDILGVYPCDICGKGFTRQRYLKKHTLVHKTDNTCLCDECGKGFKSKTYLQIHRRRHQHRVFHCNQCDFSSTIKTSILAHRQIHSNGSVLCDICGLAYTDKHTLIKHMEVHDSSRPYGCNYPGCTWRFKSEVMCKAHIRAHTVEGKFKCNLCGYIFRRKHHLQRHENKTHGLEMTKTYNLEKREKKSKNVDLENAIGSVVNSTMLKSMSQEVLLETHTDGTSITYTTADIPDGALNEYKIVMTNYDTSTLLLPQLDNNQIIQINGVEHHLVEEVESLIPVDETPSLLADDSQHNQLDDSQLTDSDVRQLTLHDEHGLTMEEIAEDIAETIVETAAVIIDGTHVVLSQDISKD